MRSRSRSSLRTATVQRAFNPSSDNLSQRVVSGAAFTFLGIALRTMVTIGSMAVLARLLTPADFGYIAMATMLTEFAALFSNVGFGPILIQRARLVRLQLDTMFWGALGLGVALTALVFGLSYASQWVFGSPLVGEILRVMCIVFVLEELTVVPRSLLARLMMFRADFAVQAIMVLVRAGAAIVLALQGWGVWSLVGGSIAGALAQALLYLVLAGYWPRLRFSAAFLRATWRTNSSYFGNGVLYYLNSNIDVMLIGRSLGASALGIYQNGRSLPAEISARMAQPLQRVLFPAFARVQDEPARFRDGIARSIRLLTVALAPVGFGIAASAEELVPLLYGGQWLEMVPVLRVFALAAGLTVATTTTATIFYAKDRADLAFKLFLVSTLLNIVLILLATRWGMMAVVYAKLVLSLSGLVILRVALGLVQLRTMDLLRMIGPPCLAATVMLLAIASLRPWIYAQTSALALQLAAMVVIGVLCYGLMVLVVARTHVRDMADVASLFLNRRRKR